MPNPVTQSQKKSPPRSSITTRPDGKPAGGPVERCPALADLVGFHAEIRAALDRLAALVQATKRAQPDAATATSLVRFFEGPLLWHDEDEEVSLIRRLRGMTLSSAQLALVEATHRGHDKMEALLDELIVELREIAKDQRAVDVVAFERNARSLKSLLDGHLALEESNLFPLIADVLSERELEAVQREIHARHGRSSAHAVRAKRALAF